MNISFGTKIIIEDFSPEMKDSADQIKQGYAEYLHQGFDMPTDQAQSNAGKLSGLKTSKSLNQKVKQLLERCSHTNIVLKDGN